MVADRSVVVPAPLRRVLCAAAGACVLALGTAPGVAAGEDRDGGAGVSVGDGVITARGAALRVPVTVTCREGRDASVALSVVEAIGDTSAYAYGAITEGLRCTGQRQRASLYMQIAGQGGGGGRPFRPGPASAVATVYASEPSEENFCTGIAPCLGPVMSYSHDGRDHHSERRAEQTIQLRTG